MFFSNENKHKYTFKQSWIDFKQKEWQSHVRAEVGF